MQGQGLLDLRRHTHEALMAQAEENSQKIQALSQELVTLEQSLKSAFTEIRNEVPKNLQERLAETGGRLHLSPTSLMLHRTHPQVQ